MCFIFSRISHRNVHEIKTQIKINVFPVKGKNLVSVLNFFFFMENVNKYFLTSKKFTI